MKTTVYLMRHSEPFKIHNGIIDVKEELLLSNIKSPLSVVGEKNAEEKSNIKEFDNLDIIWSSDYVRTMATAKYFAYKNNLKVNISDSFGERKHGVNSWSELPDDFEEHQFKDENYKLISGESQKEVRMRMFNKLIKILNENKGKRILIVSHSTAIAFLLSMWCEISFDNTYKFKNMNFFDGKWNYLETFKLEFDENYNLNSIKNIR